MRVRDNWKYTSHELPGEGVVVETASEGGLHQLLKRKGKLWFYPDGSMYVYYTPVAWRIEE